MSHVIIFHGTGYTPSEYWYPWLKNELEKDGHSVEAPHYPKINKVPIAEFVQTVLAAHEFTEDTILIGHSAGVPLIFSILEHIETRIQQAILVAGFTPFTKNENIEKDVILQDSYDWPRIKKHASNFVTINSDNDPWGCDDEQGRIIYEKLGGTQVIRHDGHFGSASLKQAYTEFPLVKRLVGLES